MRKSNTVAVFLLPEQALKPQKITQRCYVSLSTSRSFGFLFVCFYNIPAARLQD